MKRLLILFTNGFPYNNSEPFLEKEYPLYRTYFDKVLISAACSPGEKPTRILDEGFTEVLEDYTLEQDVPSVLSSIPHLLADGKYYRELFQLGKRGQLTPGRFYEITVTAMCGNHRAHRVRKWLKQHSEYDEIVLYCYWMTIPAYGALKLKKLLGNQNIRVVSRCHGYDLYSERSKPGYLPFQEMNVKSLDVVAPVSKNGAAYLRKKYGENAHIETRYLGVLCPENQNPVSERKALRILSCARVIPLKRLSRIVDALALLEETPVQWTHIGDGTGLADLKGYAREKLSGRENISVSFLGGISNQQVYELYEKEPFHVFLNVSQTEGVPVSIMEAMCFGIPVVATDVGGTSELVEDQVSGYLLNRDFRDADLAGRMMEMACLPEIRYEEMRFQARKTIRDRFDAEINYGRFIEEVLL